MLSFAPSCSYNVGAGKVFLAALLLAASTGMASAQVASAKTSLDGAVKPARTLTFDTVSIKPSGPNSKRFVQWAAPDSYSAMSTPLGFTVAMMYLSPREVMAAGSRNTLVNAPGWLMQDSYDFVAKVAAEDVAAWQKQTPVDRPLMQQMLHAALAERCKLQAHLETQNGPAYTLVVGKSTSLKVADPDQPDPPGIMPNLAGGKIVPYWRERGDDPTITLVKITMAEFAQYLSNSSSRPVINKTGLEGRYTFRLSLRDTGEEGAGVPEAASPWDLGKLGLKLVPGIGPREVVVIDHIEKPSEN